VSVADTGVGELSLAVLTIMPRAAAPRKTR